MGTIRATHGLKCGSVVVGCGPRAISASCSVYSHLCFSRLSFRHMLSIVSLRRPHNIVMSMNKRVPGGLTVGLCHRSIPMLNASPVSVSHTRGHGGFSTVLSRLKVSRPT